MRRLLTFAVICAALAVGLRAAELGPAGSLDLIYGGRFVLQSVEGDRNRSFLEEGSFHHHDFEARYGVSLGSAARFEAEYAGSASTDRLRQRDTGYQTRRWWAQLEGEGGPLGYWLKGGDQYLELSRLSFGQGLRGAAASLKAGGVSLQPFWGTLWEADELSGRARRTATGGRLAFDSSGGSGLGFNAALVQDEEGSLADPTRAMIEKNWVGSGDFRLHFLEHALWEGEAALSDHESTSLAQRQSGKLAGFSRLGWRHPRLRGSAELERSDTAFAALAGSAVPDRERAAARLDWRALEALSLRAAWEGYRDNVDRSRPYTQAVQIAQGSLGLTPWSWAEAEAGVRLRTLRSDNSPASVDKENPALTASLGLRFLGTLLTAGLESGRAMDRVAPSGDYDTFSWEAALRGSYPFGADRRLSPGLAWTSNRDTYASLGQTDRNDSGQASLTVTLGDLDVSGRGAYTQTQRQTLPEDSSRISAEAGLLYRILGRPHQTLGLRYTRLMDQATDAAKNFAENSSEATLNLRF